MLVQGLIVLCVIIAMGAGVMHWRWRRSQRHTAQAWHQLLAMPSHATGVFQPSMVSHLPESVQRFFRFTIAPGATLYTAAELQMRGQFSFGPPRRASSDPNAGYLPLVARQLLCAPHGMIWQAQIGKRFQSFVGSDGCVDRLSWTRFAWANLFPVALISGSRDHFRSAAGRMLAESVFWTPAVLLTLPSVHWEAPDAHTIIATITHCNLNLAVTLRLDDSGQAREVSFLRWSNANPDKTWRLQPFGGFLSEYREFDGIKIPTRVEAGNFFGTQDYFPFYRVAIEQLHWIDK